MDPRFIASLLLWLATVAAAVRPLPSAGQLPAPFQPFWWSALTRGFAKAPVNEDLGSGADMTGDAAPAIPDAGVKKASQGVADSTGVNEALQVGADITGGVNEALQGGADDIMGVAATSIPDAGVNEALQVGNDIVGGVSEALQGGADITGEAATSIPEAGVDKASRGGADITNSATIPEASVKTHSQSGAGSTDNATSTPEWPPFVQPFWWSALDWGFKPEEVEYVARFPLVVVNHKHGKNAAPMKKDAEAKQLEGLQQVKAANPNSQTFFYLNSQIGFEWTALFQQAQGQEPSWFLRTDDGEQVRRGAHLWFDLSLPAVRAAWLETAKRALANDYIDGIAVDKAREVRNVRGLGKARLEAFREGHNQMLADLRAATGKKIILNNNHGEGQGTLFERWGESPDHNGLTLAKNIELMPELQEQGLITLARAGGVKPGTAVEADRKTCAMGLAAFLIGTSKPDAGFFSCQPDWSSSPKAGWMTILTDPIYSQQLGAPKGPAEVTENPAGPAGRLLIRQFESGAEARLQLNPRGGPVSGCVRWSDGETSGVCPP